MLPIRIGIGHDTHRLTEGVAMLLGGVRIPCEFSLAGHSDADVLLHAVTDALLGAASLGDIGELYPDTVPENKERDSAEILTEVYRLVRKSGWIIVNLDCIIFAQNPKFGHHKLDIKLRIAEILDLASEQVNIKAKTGEKVGHIGRCEAVAAQCVALLTHPTEFRPRLLEMIAQADVAKSGDLP
ncbi:MAG: 2-C-methyl-D-erythritol 2,4-cyclodiphosphate synthase [Planctomycetaceae bacterium]|jgi:2-C-methyl-D-erythritol 2,4-cyclodiphosphate synthase|nr:2-C-methyl-D-erythritol 2,4-cyclodiphosphate synthase [Planctomycetaceae bacterium]